MRKQTNWIRSPSLILVFILVLMAAIPFGASAAKTENTYTDVSSDSFCYDPVNWASRMGVANGVSDNAFAPDNSCSRAHIVTFLWRAEGCPEPSENNNTFVDVTEEDFFYKSVLWAVEQGITKGMTETTFAPDETCTRGQIVTFLWRAEGCPDPTEAENLFADIDADSYYHKAALWAVENGITSGVSASSFQPDSACTRGQAVTFIYREATRETSDHCHDYTFDSTVFNASCTEDGYTAGYCSCGKEEKINVVPATGHLFTEWVTEQYPTTCSEGKQSRSCIACGEVESESLPIIPEEEFSIDALVAYALSYAEEQGFIIDTSMNESNASYFPALDYEITTMDEGRKAVRAVVDSTKSWLTSAFGTIEGARYNFRIEFSHVSSFGSPVYWLRDFYG